MGANVKEELQKLAEQLPPGGNWEDSMHAFYVRMKIVEGEQAIAEGRVFDQRKSNGGWPGGSPSRLGWASCGGQNGVVRRWRIPRSH